MRFERLKNDYVSYVEKELGGSKLRAGETKDSDTDRWLFALMSSKDIFSAKDI